MELLVDATDVCLSEDHSGTVSRGHIREDVAILFLYIFLKSGFFFDIIPVHF